MSLCDDLFHCKALYMVHSICLISRELNKVTKRVRVPLREGNQTEMAGSRIDILRITT